MSFCKVEGCCERCQLFSFCKNHSRNLCPICYGFKKEKYLTCPKCKEDLIYINYTQLTSKIKKLLSEPFPPLKSDYSKKKYIKEQIIKLKSYLYQIQKGNYKNKLEYILFRISRITSIICNNENQKKLKNIFTLQTSVNKSKDKMINDIKAIEERIKKYNIELENILIYIYKLPDDLNNLIASNLVSINEEPDQINLNIKIFQQVSKSFYQYIKKTYTPIKLKLLNETYKIVYIPSISDDYNYERILYFRPGLLPIINILCECPYIDLTNLLNKYKDLNLDLIDIYGMTTLHQAIKTDNDKLLELLISNKNTRALDLNHSVVMGGITLDINDFTKKYNYKMIKTINLLTIMYNENSKTFKTNGCECCDDFTDNKFICKMLEYIIEVIHRYKFGLKELEIIDDK